MLFKVAGVARQFRERLWVICRDDSCDTVIAGDFHAHFNAAELCRIETQLEVCIAAAETADDFATHLRCRGGSPLGAGFGRGMLNVRARL